MPCKLRLSLSIKIPRAFMNRAIGEEVCHSPDYGHLVCLWDDLCNNRANARGRKLLILKDLADYIIGPHSGMSDAYYTVRRSARTLAHNRESLDVLCNCVEYGAFRFRSPISNADASVWISMGRLGESKFLAQRAPTPL